MKQITRRSLLRVGIGGAAAASILSRPTWANLPTSASSAMQPLNTRSGLPWASGVFDGDPDGFARFRGAALDVINTFPNKKTWDDIKNTGGSYQRMLTSTTKPRHETVVISYPMFPFNHSPRTGGVAVWQAAARGEFDHYHAAAAMSLMRYKQKFIFRIAWEWNQPGFHWACLDPALAPYYKDYFRRIVDIMRARLPTCLIDWCSSRKGKAKAGIQHFYPGGDWVDIIGHDRYDWFPMMTTQADWDKEYNSTKLGGPVGIGAWIDYARSEGKPMSVPEWGVVTGVAGAGGDNALFVENMIAFFRAHAADMAYETYFNRNNGHLLHNLQTNVKAGLAYRASLVSPV